jgi:hypothetical protein
MDRRFAILLAIATIVSIYEVVSNNNEKQQKGRENSAEQNDADSFKQFEDAEEEPAYKYSEEAQQQNDREDEEVQIREPAGHGPIKPPINMPPITFAFW